MMKVLFHEDFYDVYTSDPAAAPGRIEAVFEAIKSNVEFVTAEPASKEEIEAVHTKTHIDSVRSSGLYSIASLAAGGALQTALAGLTEPAFALIRPPGHHASGNSAWGFCYFNNMAIALTTLKKKGLIETAVVLDFDLHFGDGTVNILENETWVTICNPSSNDREGYIEEVRTVLRINKVDIIGVSAGFDHHVDDWGGLLTTDDYQTIGTAVKEASQKNSGGYFAVFEGGYNHDVLGQNVAALLEGFR